MAVADASVHLASVDTTQADGGLRTAIFILWHLIANAPPPITHQYAFITEEYIVRDARALLSRSNLSDFGFSAMPTDNELIVIRRIGACLRALETLYSEFDLGGRAANPNREWRVRFGDQEAFFVPIARIGWRQSKEPMGDSRPFSQRGLTRVRLIPTIVDGATVKIVRPDRPQSTGKSAFGAALFRDIEFGSADDRTSFLVNSFQANDLESHISNVCEESHRSRCIVVAFPELTISPTSRDLIRDLLIEKPWLDHSARDPGITPALVIAGSWHEPSDQGYTNISTIYDGDGDVILRYKKRYPYRDELGKVERIVPGSEIPIIVLDSGLYAFGICLDFCQRYFDTSYGDLDVDYVIVPSCGNESTMGGHIRTSDDLRERSSARPFVVQQAFPTIPEGLGYILFPDGKPTGRRAGDLIASEDWNVYEH